MSTHRHPRLTESRRREVPSWIAEVERLARSDPSATLADAGRMINADRERVVQWLCFYGRHDLVMRLRTAKTQIAWTALIDEALDRDPNLTLPGLAALFGRSQKTLRRAVIASDRRDLADRLGIKARPRRIRHKCPPGPRRTEGPSNPDRMRYPGPSVPGWGAVVEAVLVGRPGLTLTDLAQVLGRDPNTITEALTRADRTDLVNRLARNDEHRSTHRNEHPRERGTAGPDWAEVA